MPPHRVVGKKEPYQDPLPDPAADAHDDEPAGDQAAADQHAEEPAEEPAAPAAPPEPEDTGQGRVVARFDHPAAAAGYLGQLLDGDPRGPVVRRGDNAWWVEGDLSLPLARELTRLCGARGYLLAGDQLLLDPGWGPAPRPGQAESRPVAGLADVPLADLVRAAGLRTRPAGRPRQLHVLAPAERAAVWIRRGLDLSLSVSYRPVRVAPLFGEPGSERAGTLTEVRLRAVQRDADRRPELPGSLVEALDRDREVLACRLAGRLMIQHGRYSPLPDQQLEAVLQMSQASEAGTSADHGQTWVLADPPHGCLTLEPLAGFADGWHLVEFGPAHRLDPGRLAQADTAGTTGWPEAAQLRVVRTSRTGDPLDALLLDDADLGFLRSLLEGHPLADLAHLVPGRDRHLLLAAGGIIDRIPIGRYLARVGPVPVYVAHGWRTDPRLPAAAWQQLVGGPRNHAMVLEPDRTLVFDLTRRQPVWELWAGPLPPFDEQLPEGAETVLRDLDAADAARATPRRSPARGAVEPASKVRRWVERVTGTADKAARASLTWQQEAMDAVTAGDPERAARLHETHGDYLRAGQLFEDAAALKESSG